MDFMVLTTTEYMLYVIDLFGYLLLHLEMMPPKLPPGG
jgi:hypothetical protein